MISIDINSQNKRAIVYLAWGERYLSLAIKSSTSAAIMNLPIILLTDTQTAQLVPRDHPFSHVKIIQFIEYGFFAKLQVFENLPYQYSSFLFLDVDTTIIKDVSFGFEMAELHGIALVPAPYYSLDHFRGFGHVMEHMGVPRRGQYIYNSGVIFMSRLSKVDAVFTTWKYLSYKLTSETNYLREDQPFLSLALELLHFNPYSLPPTYNYRGMIGEAICGDVYIWHSDHPAPKDINVYSRVWPPRGYIGSLRIENVKKQLKQPKSWLYQFLYAIRKLLRKLSPSFHK